MAGSRQVTHLEAERYVPDRLWYCPTSAAKPVIESKYKLRPGPADLHLLVGSWNLRWIAYIYVWLESSYDPPEGHPGQLAYTFLISILSTSFISVSIFSVCCTLEYLSQWKWRTWGPLSSVGRSRLYSSIFFRSGERRGITKKSTCGRTTYITFTSNYQLDSWMRAYCVIWTKPLAFGRPLICI